MTERVSPFSRVKPTNEEKASTRPAAKEDYERLVTFCIEAVIHRQWDVLIEFSRLIKFRKENFPCGVIHEETVRTTTRRIKTRKLLDWLHEKGYSEFNTEHIMKSSRQFEYDLCAFDRMINDIGE